MLGAVCKSSRSSPELDGSVPVAGDIVTPECKMVINAVDALFDCLDNTSSPAPAPTSNKPGTSPIDEQMLLPSSVSSASACEPSKKCGASTSDSEGSYQSPSPGESTSRTSKPTFQR